MELSSIQLVGKTKFFRFVKYLFMLWMGILCTDLSAHGTQVEYCFTNDNMVRIYIEHWHGNETNFSSSQVNMTIIVDGVPTTMNVPASGFVHDTPQSALPNCSAPSIQISECTTVADTYNDWAFFDFPAPDCFSTLVIQVNSVIDPSFVLVECGASRGGPIYPAATPDITREDEFPPFIDCPTALPDIELSCGQAIPPSPNINSIAVSDDCTANEDIVFTVTEATDSSIGFSCAGEAIIRTYTFTDDEGQSTVCEQNIFFANDVTPPSITCPTDLQVSCDDPNAEEQIAAWLESFTVSDNCNTTIIVDNDYSDAAFALQTELAPFENTGVYNLGSVALSFISKSLKDSYLTGGYAERFLIKETTNSDQYDKVIKTRLRYLPGMAIDFSDVLIVDAQDRIIPIDFNKVSPEAFAEIAMKVPELKAGQDNAFRILYGKCHHLDLSIDTPIVISQEREHIIISDLLSNTLRPEHRRQNASIDDTEGMDCKCKVTQGTQTFSINPLKNAVDDIAFFAYNDGAAGSANTGLESKDAVVLFLYENSQTGEISMFVLIDAVGGDGGSGSIDFYCLPMSATLDYADDNGEITALFPTVMASWRWADCCTDGAIIGNLGCDSAFDFLPDFSDGINSIKWVSGSIDEPVYNTFNSITESVRIHCGKEEPSCCPNSNTVNIVNVTCPTESDGAIDIVPDKKEGPYDFVWNTGAVSEDLSCLTYGKYTVTITDKNDCVQVSTFKVGSKEQEKKFFTKWAEAEILHHNTRANRVIT